MAITPELLKAILAQFQIDQWGIHGLSHWARVFENGRKLQEQTGARLDVVELFAVFHDAGRWDNGLDWFHGKRSAGLAKNLLGTAYDLDQGGFDLLCQACAGHTSGLGSRDVTVWTCWDADRLDIGRVGWLPDPKQLFTSVAKDPGMCDWGFFHSQEKQVPSLVWDEWKIGSVDGF